MDNLGSTEVIQTSDNERVTTHNGHLYQKFDTPDQNIQDDEPAIILSKTLVTDQKMSMEIEENKSMIRITIKNTSKSNIIEENSSQSTSTASTEYKQLPHKLNMRKGEEFMSQPTSSAASGGSNTTTLIKNQPIMESEEEPSVATSSDTSLKQCSLSSESRTMLVPSQKVKDQVKIPLTSFAANGSSILKKCQLNVGTEEKSSAATSSANFSEQSSFSKSDKEVEFLITEEKFRSRSSSVSGGSNISIKRDNGLNCKIETKHSPASLPGTSSMQSPPSSTNEEFVEPNEVGVRRRQLNLANGGNKMPIKEPKVSPDSDQVRWKDKIRSLAMKHLFAQNIKKIFCCYCKHFMFVILFMIFVISITVYMYKSQGSNITVEHDNSLDCKIETQHSPASLQDCKHSSDFANAVVNLKKSFYVRDTAIHYLSRCLLLDTPRSRIIVLFGSSPYIGTWYTVETIKVYFPRQYAIRRYSPPIRTWIESENPFVDADLIIMEKLKESDLIETVDFLKRHQDAYEDRFVTVLAVFNFEHIDDHSLRGTNSWRSVNAIRDAFLNKNISVEIIHYNFFVEDAFVQKIEREKGDTIENIDISYIPGSQVPGFDGESGEYYIKIKFKNRKKKIFWISKYLLSDNVEILK